LEILLSVALYNKTPVLVFGVAGRRRRVEGRERELRRSRARNRRKLYFDVAEEDGGRGILTRS
jgi:hypothetical protein